MKFIIFTFLLCVGLFCFGIDLSRYTMISFKVYLFITLLYVITAACFLGMFEHKMKSILTENKAFEIMVRKTIRKKVKSAMFDAAKCLAFVLAFDLILEGAIGDTEINLYIGDFIVTAKYKFISFASTIYYLVRSCYGLEDTIEGGKEILRMLSK